MANLFSSPSHKANIGYNGFDMSHVLKFTSTTGELLPVYKDFLQAGDKVSLSTELRTRTMPLETAAMCKVTEYLEWFFVPITQIYQFFPEFYYGIQDTKTSYFNVSSESVSSNFPFITGATFTNYVNQLLGAHMDDYFANSTYFNQGHPLKGMSLRLIEALGIPTQYIFDYLSRGSADAPYAMTMGINPMFACAYQKIFFDYYRLSDREINNPDYYNLDIDVYNGQTSTSDTAKFFTMRYRPFAKDYYTNLFTSPLFGATSLGNSGVNLVETFQQWLAPVDLRTSDNTGSGETTSPTTIRPATSVNGSTTDSLLMIRNALSPDAIRTSFAVQKLLEVTRRAGKHYDAQTLAHFGVDVPTGISGEVMFLGSTCKSDIQIGDVISTSSVPNGSALGQVAGKGYGYGSGSTIKFTAPSHGILMCIYSCVPDSDYPQYGLDKLNTMINTAAFPRPEYDNLGMQPLFNYETELDTRPTPLVPNDGVAGWQYRWSECKTKYNRVIGGLLNGRSLSSWSVQRTNFGSSSITSFYCSPWELNSIMLVPFCWDTSDASLMSNPYSSDPLIHQLYFDVKKSSKMSTYGLPSL